MYFFLTFHFLFHFPNTSQSFFLSLSHLLSLSASFFFSPNQFPLTLSSFSLLLSSPLSVIFFLSLHLMVLSPSSSIFQCVGLSNYLFMWIYLSVCLFVCLYIPTYLCLYVFLSLCHIVYLSEYLSVCFTHLFFSVFLFINWYLCIHV